MSCFGQWRMSFHMDNAYRELNHIFLVPDTLQSYSSLWLSYTVIVNWLAHKLVWSFSTSLYINIVGCNMSEHTYIHLRNVWNTRRNFNLFHHLVTYIQIASLKLFSLPTSTWHISLIPTTCPHTNSHHALLHPLAMMRHRTEGGYVTLALVHDLKSTSETLVQIGMWAIWNSSF
jgi:hypothetical protein